ncbi:LYR motif-containing protein 2 [Chamberlinius hualienensis]
MGGRNLPSGVLSLKRFILRREVITLYRDLLRIAKQISDQNQQKQVKEWVKADFKANKHHQDEETIKYLLAHGRQFLKQLQTTITLTK